MVAVHYINCMGGTRSDTTLHIVLRTLGVASSQEISVHAEHLPGTQQHKLKYKAKEIKH